MDLKMPNTDTMELFGDTPAEQRAAWAEYCLYRYGRGDSLRDISADIKTQTGKDCPPETLRAWMIRRDYAEYKDARDNNAEHRAEWRQAQYARAVGLSLKRTIDMLEDDDVELTPSDLCRIEKTMGDRLSLMQGKPTERTEGAANQFTVILSEKAVRESGASVDSIQPKVD